MISEDVFDISDRVVLITGGLGQLGLSYARALLERGARVAILDQIADSEAYEKRFGTPPDQSRLIAIEADVTDRLALEAALARVESAWAVPNGLINNAAIDSPPDAPASENGPFESYPERSWDRVMDVNVKGCAQCCQVVGGAMAAAGRGSIINICSIYGLVSPDQRLYAYRRDTRSGFYKPAAYSVSKSALLNLTRYLATYWADRGVRVNTLTLGGVFNNQDPAFLDGYSARVPLGRMAHEDDYNGAVVFLLSDASAYMTGSNLVIDGGWTAW